VLDRQVVLRGGLCLLAVGGLALALSLVWSRKAAAPDSDEEGRPAGEPEVMSPFWAERAEEARGAQPPGPRAPRQWAREGRQEAEREIQAGRLYFAVFGHARIKEPAEARAERRRLGISWLVVGSDIYDERLVRTAKTFNERMAEEVERRFGSGALERVWKAPPGNFPD
jgi:hypothetical protein